MSESFVVNNQLGQFWGKKKAWVDGREPKKILLLKHEDEGINLLVELSARDYELRGEVTPVSLNEKGLPEVEASEHLIEDEPELKSVDEEPSADEGQTSVPEEPSQKL